jgi:hypothetical protein
MDEDREKQRNAEGIDTADQPAEGGPYIEEPTAENRGQTEEHASRPPQTSKTSPRANREELVSLFEKDASEKFRSRWLDIQSRFVDDPSDSVKQADELVADVIDGITRSFANRRSTLEKQWNGGEQASTEDLRIALKQYRSFFDRLLTLDS